MQAELIRTKGIRRINVDRTESICQRKCNDGYQKASGRGLWIVAVKYSGLKDLLSQMKKADVRNPVVVRPKWHRAYRSCIRDGHSTYRLCNR